VTLFPHRRIRVDVGVARPVRRWSPKTLMSDEIVGTVSPGLRRTVRELGPDAERWLVRVPALVAEVSTAWKLQIGRALVHEGCASVILPVTTDRGVAAVLKLSVPHDESRYEGAALERWGGDGAVSVLRSSADGFTLLLERCEPGHDLWRLGVCEQIEVMADLLPRLWTTPAPEVPFRQLAETTAGWVRQMEAKAAAMGLSRPVADRARRWAEELVDRKPRRLLHGDFHPENILAGRRRPWLAIDPKPIVGDPAFDLAQVLGNWVFVDLGDRTSAADALRARAEELADRLSLDLDAVLRWAVVKAIAWNFGRDKTLVLDEAASTA
jgi:streptomycin 6-kinase